MYCFHFKHGKWGGEKLVQINGFYDIFTCLLQGLLHLVTLSSIEHMAPHVRAHSALLIKISSTLGHRGMRNTGPE